MSTNEQLRERAALDHALWAARTAKDKSDEELGQIDNAALALLLGRLIRGVDEINTRLETLEDMGKRMMPPPGMSR